MMKKVSVLTLALFVGLLNAEKQLKFNSNGKFKMVQFTDIHFGETHDADVKNQELIAKVLELEQPDIAIITGDVVSGFAWDGYTKPWFSLQYANFTKTLLDHNVYWALTAGNHDSQADLTREQISDLDRTYNLSLTKPNAANITHSFNYWLPVYDSNGTNTAFRLWFMDSGDEGCLGTYGYDCVRPDQVEWFREENNKISQDDQSKGKGFLFVHIPLFEYINLYNNDKIFGQKGEDICCWAVNTGLFAAMKEQKTVEWVSVGHDHNNDYYGNYEGINLAYGRKTGYGCYGPSGMQHGARVFEVTESPYGIQTWVRQEDGSIHQETETHGRSYLQSPQTKCCEAYDKAINIDPHDEEMQFLREYYLKRADLKHLIIQ